MRTRCPGLKSGLQADPDPAVCGGGQLSLGGRWPGLKSCCDIRHITEHLWASNSFFNKQRKKTFSAYLLGIRPGGRDLLHRGGLTLGQSKVLGKVGVEWDLRLTFLLVRAVRKHEPARWGRGALPMIFSQG